MAFCFQKGAAAKMLLNELSIKFKLRMNLLFAFVSIPASHVAGPLKVCKITYYLAIIKIESVNRLLIPVTGCWFGG